MSAANPIFFGEAIRQQQPWKSPWRLDLERRMAEDATRPTPPRRMAQAAAPVKARKPECRVGRKQVRAAKPRRMCERECGRYVIKGNLVCSRCSALHPRRPCGYAEARACSRTINANNTTGLCKACRGHDNRRVARAAATRARPACKFRGCVRKLNRSNSTGLCSWHNPRYSNRARFRSTSCRPGRAVAREGGAA